MWRQYSTFSSFSENVQHQSHSGGNPLEIPDMGYGWANSICPSLSLTFAFVTSKPQRSQTIPLNRILLYFPQWHSQSSGTKYLFTEKAFLSALRSIVDCFRLLTSPWSQPLIYSGDARLIRSDSKLFSSCISYLYKIFICIEIFPEDPNLTFHPTIIVLVSSLNPHILKEFFFKSDFRYR